MGNSYAPSKKDFLQKMLLSCIASYSLELHHQQLERIVEHHRMQLAH